MFEDSVSTIPSIWAFMNSWLTPTVLFLLLNLMIGTIAITSSLGTHKHHEQHQNQQHENHQQYLQARQLARSPSMLQRLKSINFYSYRSQESTTAYHKSPEIETHYTFGYTQEPEQPKLTRSPSILQRLKSFNPYNYIPHEFTTPSQSSSTIKATATTLPEKQEPLTHYDFEQTHVREQPTRQKFEEEQEEDEEIEEDHFPYEDEEQSTQTIDEIYSQLKGGQIIRSQSDTEPTVGKVTKKLLKKMKKSASSKSAFGHFKEEDIVERRRPATVREGKVSRETEADEEVDAKADHFINKFKNQLKLQRLDSIVRYKEMITRGSAPSGKRERNVAGG